MTDRLSNLLFENLAGFVPGFGIGVVTGVFDKRTEMRSYEAAKLEGAAQEWENEAPGMIRKGERMFTLSSAIIYVPGMAYVKALLSTDLPAMEPFYSTLRGLPGWYGGIASGLKVGKAAYARWSEAKGHFR